MRHYLFNLWTNIYGKKWIVYMDKKMYSVTIHIDSIWNRLNSSWQTEYCSYLLKSNQANCKLGTLFTTLGFLPNLWMGLIYQSIFVSIRQGILKGEVSLYHWPPVWLVWNQLYDNWQILFLFAKQTNPNQTSQVGGQRYSDTSPFSFPCIRHLQYGIT